MDVQHKDLTSIHLFALISDTDPDTTLGANKAWVDTTDPVHPQLKLRNADNDDWIDLGLVNGITMLLGVSSGSNIVLSTSEGLAVIQAGAGLASIEMDANTQVIRFTASGGLELNGLAVTIGAADSGGIGFRALRVPN